MIRLENISRQYGGVHALRSIDLELQTGEWLGLAGPNGSGKTTMLRIILGLTQPSSGQVYLEGELPDAQAWIRFRKKLGFMPERISFYDNLTGKETLEFLASVRGASPTVIEELLEKVGLSDASSRKVGGYSKGMRQRLNFAQALLDDPEVLILDEPTEGLDPHAVRHFFTLLKSDRPRTVLLSSHRLSELETRADRICVLGEGDIKALGSPRDLMAATKQRSRVHIVVVNGTMDSHGPQLAEMGFAHANGVPGHLRVAIPYAEKVAFLNRLHASGAELKDVWIEETDLEEAYFEAH